MSSLSSSIVLVFNVSSLKDNKSLILTEYANPTSDKRLGLAYLHMEGANGGFLSGLPMADIPAPGKVRFTKDRAESVDKLNVKIQLTEAHVNLVRKAIAPYVTLLNNPPREVSKKNSNVLVSVLSHLQLHVEVDMLVNPDYDEDFLILNWAAHQVKDIVLVTANDKGFINRSQQVNYLLATSETPESSQTNTVPTTIEETKEVLEKIKKNRRRNKKQVKESKARGVNEVTSPIQEIMAKPIPTITTTAQLAGVAAKVELHTPTKIEEDVYSFSLDEGEDEENVFDLL